MKYAEFCAGYGGLGLAVEEVFGAELAWYSEIEPAPSRIMERHWPNVPNHGDMTTIDFTTVEPVDILSGGTPCQDLSHAGRRAGMRKGTRSGLWESMREAIATIKPTYVVWENVRGAYSAGADSDLEQCPGCLGETTPGKHSLRALGRVLGDLADLGYDTQWRGLRAADVGAPHGRYRVFVLAAYRDHIRSDRRWKWPEQDRRGQPAYSGNATAQPEGVGWVEGWTESAGQQRRPDVTERGPSTPADTKSVGPGDNLIRGGEGVPETAGTNSQGTAWGPYEPAIRRWEAVRGTAPAPTELTAKGKHRLSARFAEWMMGIPTGWVTGTPGVSRNEQLKAIGNGVVPQQAAAALQHMLRKPPGKSVPPLTPHSP